MFVDPSPPAEPAANQCPGAGLRPSARALVEAGERDQRLWAQAGEIRTLAAQINAAHAEMVDLLVEFTDDGFWNNGASWRSLSQWLVVNCGMTTRAANEVCAIVDASRSGAMPTVMERARKGELSVGVTAMVARVADPDNEAALANIATTATAPQLAQTLRCYRKVKPDEPAPTQPRGPEIDPVAESSPAPPADAGSNDETWWRTWTDFDGAWRVSGKAPIEIGALLDEAFEAARRSAQRNAEGSPASAGAGVAEHGTSESGGAESGHDSEAPARVPVPSTYETLRHFAHLALQSANADRLTREGGEPFCVNVMIDIDTLVTGRLRPDSRCELSNGTALTPPVVAMLAEAGILQLLWHQDGVPLKLGTAARFASPAQRKLLLAQYGGCANPACDQRRHLHFHHVKRFPDGPTDVDNMVPVCGRDHRAIHDGSLRVEIVDGVAVFYDADGEEIRGRLADHVRSVAGSGGGAADESDQERGGSLGRLDERPGVPVVDDYTAKPNGGGAHLGVSGLNDWMSALLHTFLAAEARADAVRAGTLGRGEQ